MIKNIHYIEEFGIIFRKSSRKVFTEPKGYGFLCLWNSGQRDKARLGYFIYRI